MQREDYTAYDPKGRRKYLSRKEGRAFVNCARRLSREHSLFCLTLFYTGIRISEALALTAGDVDLDTSTIGIRCLKKRKRMEYRRIPVPEFLSKGLAKLAAEKPESRPWSYSRTTAWRIIKRVMSSAKIEGIHATTKGLRHAFGVRGALEQIPLSIIQGWMGHANPATTAIYLAVCDEEELHLIRRTWK